MVIFAVWAVNETEFATGEAYADFFFVALIAETLPILFKRYAFIKTWSVYEKSAFWRQGFGMWRQRTGRTEGAADAPYIVFKWLKLRLNVKIS